MENTQKMAVIPQDLLETLKFNQLEKAGPIGKHLISIDKDIEDILQKKDLDLDEKVQLYYQTLSKYLNAKKNYKTIQEQKPLLINNDVPEKNNEAKTPATKNDWEEMIRRTLPKVEQDKGVEVYKWIKKNFSNENFNEKGQFQDINKSNIVDLISSVVSRKKKEKPHGFDEFVNELQKSNIPTVLIGNDDVKKTYFSSFATPDGEVFSTPKAIEQEDWNFPSTKEKKKRTKKRRREKENKNNDSVLVPDHYESPFRQRLRQKVKQWSS